MLGLRYLMFTEVWHAKRATESSRVFIRDFAKLNTSSNILRRFQIAIKANSKFFCTFQSWEKLSNHSIAQRVDQSQLKLSLKSSDWWDSPSTDRSWKRWSKRSTKTNLAAWSLKNSSFSPLSSSLKKTRKPVSDWSKLLHNAELFKTFQLLRFQSKKNLRKPSDCTTKKETASFQHHASKKSWRNWTINYQMLTWMAWFLKLILVCCGSLT